jgi:glycogen debranching enzyme
VDRVSEEQPGKILHEHRFDAASRAELPQWKFPYYGSIDSTLLFLIVGAAYLKKTEDRHLTRQLWKAFRSAHEWIGRYGDADGDGFIEYERTNPAGLFHQGWKDGSGDHLRIRPPVALVEVQGYAVAAHAAFASLAEAAGEKTLASVALEAAERVRHQVNRHFWLEDQGFFALALDGTKQIRRAVTSNPGHLLLCGAVEPRRLDAMVSRLFSPDLWTPFGIRTHSSREPDFDPASYHLGSVWPHDNWFLFRGLLAVGREAEARRVREALLKAYETLGRMPELYAVVDDRLIDLSQEETSFGRANPVQAWSSAGFLDMISRDPDEKVSP